MPHAAGIKESSAVKPRLYSNDVTDEGICPAYSRLTMGLTTYEAI